MSNIESTLKERGNRYGEFKDFSEISQTLKNIIFLELTLKVEPEYKEVNNVILEGIEMVCHKLARIANGDAYYLDSWRDLSAYAKLVCDELEKTDGVTDVKTKQVVRRRGKWVHEMDLEPILNKVDETINSKEPKTLEEKCMDCKYLNHVLSIKNGINFYVCEHPNNLEASNIIHNNERIMRYKNIENIWEDCKYKEHIIKKD